MIVEIWEPRYRDRTVLIAKNKIVEGKDLGITIQKGAYKGDYIASAAVLAESPDDVLKTKSGANLNIKAVPLDKLERFQWGNDQ